MVKKKCLYCGKKYYNQNRNYCSRECYVKSVETWYTCPICGDKFKAEPSDKRKTCGKQECTQEYKKSEYMDIYIRNAKNATSHLISSPNTGRFDTHGRAKTWILNSPYGDTYEINNLKKWCRDNKGIIPDVDDNNFYKSINAIKRSDKGLTKKKLYQYKGWTLEKFYEENLLIKDTTSQ